MVPLHARPVVESLQRQVDIFIRFQFQHSQASLAGRGQHIDHGAVAGGKCRHLGVHESRIKRRIHGGDVPDDQRLQPALRLHAPESMVVVAVGETGFEKADEELAKEPFAVAVQNGFMGTGAEGDFVLRSLGFGAGEFQSVQTEGNLAGGDWRQLHFAGILDERKHALDGGLQSLPGDGRIQALYQARGDVATVPAVDELQAVFGFVKLVQLKFGSHVVQAGQALADHGARAGWKEQFQPFHDGATGFFAAAIFQPQ
ncbi:MAG: hypothetical protein DMG67_15810 [Acidobacteria bacterium]|nr:MAG: hypothetical protein DMG67_15810 [Acidobacteriota bacterium]